MSPTRRPAPATTPTAGPHRARQPNTRSSRRSPTACSAVDEADRADFPALASAVADNQRLWAGLAEDLMSDGNRLPVPLRAS